jgi:hypothetical protein
MALRPVRALPVDEEARRPRAVEPAPDLPLDCEMRVLPVRWPQWKQAQPANLLRELVAPARDLRTQLARSASHAYQRLTYLLSLRLLAVQTYPRATHLWLMR